LSGERAAHSRACGVRHSNLFLCPGGSCSWLGVTPCICPTLTGTGSKLSYLDPRGGRPRTDDRLVITGILHSLATGAPFAELEPYGNPRTLETRFRRWSQDGTLQRIFDAIGFKPMSPHERHLRHGMGRAQRQAMRDKGWSRYW